MENDKKCKREESQNQDSGKRSIYEVDDHDEIVTEGNKKIKYEDDTIESENNVTLPEAVTRDGKNVNNEEKSVKGDPIVAVEQKINYSKKKKCVLLLSYCGSGYNGMQRNPGVKTIEEDLTNALFKARAITEDASRNYGKMSFQRCARTDKGVSAARQVVSLKMVPYKELLPVINKHLEPQIRVFSLKQVTRGFDCKSRCSSRTYEYLLPTFAFSPTFAHTTRDFRITKEIIDELNLVLKKYEGTKNFHNFTSGKDFKEESAKRYIINFHVAGEPFVENNMEFLVLQVQGQSFMQHQIRKMIGLAVAIMKKYTGLDAVFRAFQQPKMDIPRAPGLGLVLDQVHFRSYNQSFGRDGFHEPLEWSECEDQIKKFKKQYIHRQIIETEANTNSMMRWLTTLPTHTYSSEGMMELQKNKVSDANKTAETSVETTEEKHKESEEMPSNENTIISSDVADEKTNPADEETSICIAPSTTEKQLENETAPELKKKSNTMGSSDVKTEPTND